MVEGSGSVCMGLKLGKQDIYSHRFHRCLETKHPISITPYCLPWPRFQPSAKLFATLMYTWIDMDRSENLESRLSFDWISEISDMSLHMFYTFLHWINLEFTMALFAGGSMKLRKHEWRIAAAKRFAEPKVVTTLHPIRRKVAVHYVYYIRHWWV